MKEKLQEYALIAEIISAVAIIASLIFVGLQIRQGALQTELNTKAMELNMADNYITQINSTDQILLDHPEILEITGKRMSGESISFSERIRANIYIRTLFRVWQNTFYQFQNSSLDERFLSQVKNHITGLMNGNILVSEYWNNFKNDFDPEFVKFVEENSVNQ